MSEMIKENFLAEVRAVDDKLKKARITSVEIIKTEKRIRYIFICDNFIDDELQKKVWIIAKKYTPKIFSYVNVIFKKIVANDELINAEIFKFVSANFPSVAVTLKPTDVKTKSSEDESIIKYILMLTKDGADYMAKCGGFSKINDCLSKKFCADFSGSAEIKEVSDKDSILIEEVYAEQLEKINYRTIKVKNVFAIDDPLMGSTALYIEDAISGAVTVCGKITDIKERVTKTEKPFFIIQLDDTTGRISGVYFSKKATLSKIRELAVGDFIIASGNIGEYRGQRSFTIDKINRCEFPEDFVKKDRYKKSVPKNYKTVFPTRATTVSVKSVFEQNDVLPQSLTENTYVVFDLETTGLDVLNNEITEIGAVKIENGKITEQFVTLVKPNGKIPQRIVELTGIDDEMVKDAPDIETVLPDFMKFIDGAILVAQNSDFDVPFIKRYAGANDYAVNNSVEDTVILSRQLLPQLRRNDLKTLAEHFNITFRHHRALSDAYATAEIFIELKKMEK